MAIIAKRSFYYCKTAIIIRKAARDELTRADSVRQTLFPRRPQIPSGAVLLCPPHLHNLIYDALCNFVFSHNRQLFCLIFCDESDNIGVRPKACPLNL